MIYHIVEKAAWQSQSESEIYVHPSLESEGFIHCSTAEQVEGVLQRYYSGVENLLQLTIDEAKVKAQIKYEEAPSGGLYPHIFGGINKDAIKKIASIT